MRKKIAWTVVAALVLGLGGYWWMGRGGRLRAREGKAYLEVEEKLAPLARELEEPRPGDWLWHHDEPGQTFGEYLDADPVRKDRRRHTIYLCLVGEFSREQKRVIDLARKYLGVFFDAPVRVRKRLALEDIPQGARRVQPATGNLQLLTTYVLDEVLQPDLPDDALAYLAFTASDLWPGAGWNFVFGQANLY